MRKYLDMSKRQTRGTKPKQENKQLKPKKQKHYLHTRPKTKAPTIGPKQTSTTNLGWQTTQVPRNRKDYQGTNPNNNSWARRMSRSHPT